VLHVFDVVDEAAFIEHYKQRYERPLREIFE
jgi:multicomponent K+:H+ antiporter subunit E